MNTGGTNGQAIDTAVLVYEEKSLAPLAPMAAKPGYWSLPGHTSYLVVLHGPSLIHMQLALGGSNRAYRDFELAQVIQEGAPHQQVALVGQRKYHCLLASPMASIPDNEPDPAIATPDTNTIRITADNYPLQPASSSSQAPYMEAK